MENIRRDLRSMGELKTAQRILNSYNFNGIEVAEYTNSYSNLVTGTSIFIDVDAYTFGSVACIDFDYHPDNLSFYIRFTNYARPGKFSPEETIQLAEELTNLANCVNELNAEVDMKQLKNTLDMYYKGRI